MAKVVLGIGTSHSPMLATTAEQYFVHADKDKMREVMAPDGNFYSYDELMKVGPPPVGRALEPATVRERLDRCTGAIDRLKRSIADARPDLLVVIGDDQMELFRNDNMPAFSVFWGKRIMNVIPPAEEMPPGVALSAWQTWDDTPTYYPSHEEFGLFLIKRLIADKFDVAQFREQRTGTGGGMSHSHTFVHKRLETAAIPMVPVFINTYYPPNQPTMARCLEFGRAIRRAIDAWPGDARVAVFASGGLSHFVVDEQLDRKFIDALRRDDEQALVSIPERSLQSGNSELKLWAALWAGMTGLKLRYVDYVPLMRSEAATGTGAAFAEWA